jgi:hypothetical protein
MSPFEQELSRNSESGAAYIFGKEGTSDFEDYDMADATVQLQKLGHEIVQSVFERQVVDLDAAVVVRRGIIKVLPALSRKELGIISQETGFSAQPVLH